MDNVNRENENGNCKVENINLNFYYALYQQFGMNRYGLQVQNDPCCPCDRSCLYIRCGRGLSAQHGWRVLHVLRVRYGLLFRYVLHYCEVIICVRDESTLC